MPESVGKAVEAATSVGLEDPSVRADVRDVGERLVPEAALLEHADARLPVQLAVQPGGEGELLLVGQCLAAEHEHRVPVHPTADRLEQRLVVRFPNVYAARFGDEGRMKIAKFEGHVSVVRE